MAGAAYLATASCLRSGTGKVTLGTTEDVYRILGASLPEALSLILKPTSVGSINQSSLRSILDYAKNVDVVAIGPGLGRHPSTKKLVEGLITKLSCQIILDADGINCIAGQPLLLKKAKKTVIITPHEGELKALFGKKVSSASADRKAVAKRIATQYHCILVRKGFQTLVASPDGSVYQNKSGNPGLASGGTGDVLTGLIAGLVAQGFGPAFAARLGVYLHGKAGDVSAKKVGEAALVASDLLRTLPDLIKQLEKRKDLQKLE